MQLPLTIAGNTAGTVSSDCEVFTGGASTLVSLGHNLIATAGSSCAISGETSTNLLNVDPQLGPRALAGTGMPLYRPATSGPAAGAIPLSACADAKGVGVVADMQGVARPGSNHSFCDIGAVENELAMLAYGFE